MGRLITLPGPLTLLMYRAGEEQPIKLRLENGDRLTIDPTPDAAQGRVFEVMVDDQVRVSEPRPGD